MFRLFYTLALLSVASGWRKAKEEKLPGELRVVNEGLAHGLIPNRVDHFLLMLQFFI